MALKLPVPIADVIDAWSTMTGVMRQASPGDIDQLVTMMAEFYAEGGYPLNHRHAAEAFATLLADDRLGYVWFIQADGQDVGYLVVTLCYSMESGERAWPARSLARHSAVVVGVGSAASGL